MRISIDPTDPGYRPRMLCRVCPERFAVFFEGAWVRDKVLTADEGPAESRNGLLHIERAGERFAWIGEVEIIRLGTAKLPNGYIVSIVPDLSGNGFSVAGWPAGDPVIEPGSKRRWFHDCAARLAWDAAEIRAMIDEIGEALPPTPRAPEPERIRYC